MSVSFRGTENYVASPELMGAVDIAVALQKPLLIKGEPGTGKTMMGEVSQKVSIEKVLRAVGVACVKKADPLNLAQAVSAVREAAGCCGACRRDE